MEPLHRVDSFSHLKILADPRRLAILRSLMRGPGTLSSLGKALDAYPAQIRHHLKQLEGAGLVGLVEERPQRGYVEKIYRATASAFYISELVLPAGGEDGRMPVAVIGSHDLALELLARQAVDVLPIQVLPLAVGSLDGLALLRQGATKLAGCHLYDTETGDFNLPYVRHFFPDRPVALLTLAERQQGLLVAPGNPLGIRGCEDLARPGVVLVNRNRGSGTRLWLDRRLRQLGIPGDSIWGYKNEVSTHTEVAETIRRLRADIGLGLAAAAQEAGLEFIPLFHERYELVTPQEGLQNPTLQRLFDLLQGNDFRRAVSALAGYDTSQTGTQRTHTP